METPDQSWRRLALQFDAHRIQALSNLRAMLEDPIAHANVVREFLKAPPLSGEVILANRIKTLRLTEKPVAWRHRFLRAGPNNELSNWILTEEKPSNVWPSGKPIEGFEMEPLYGKA